MAEGAGGDLPPPESSAMVDSELQKAESKGEMVSFGDNRESSKVLEMEKRGGSWAGVVQGNPKMQRYDYQVEEIDGVKTIRVPSEILENSPPLWEDLLVGKFLGTAPLVGRIFVLVNKIWTLGDR